MKKQVLLVSNDLVTFICLFVLMVVWFFFLLMKLVNLCSSSKDITWGVLYDHGLARVDTA